MVSEASAAEISENVNFDNIDDGYFTDADRAEMHADTIRVRSATNARLPILLRRPVPLSCPLCNGRSERRGQSGWRGRLTRFQNGTAPQP